MRTIKKQHLHTLPAVNSKTVGYGIIIIFLLFAGVILISSNSGKNHSAPAFVPIMNNTDNDGTSQPENNGEEIPSTTEDPIKTGVSFYSNDSDAGVPDIGMGGIDNPPDITQLLIPVDEKYKTGRYGEKKMEGPEKYLKVISHIPEKELSFAIGYMKGCENGCTEQNCPEACLIPENWIETKRFISTQKIENPPEENPPRERYSGSFSKINNPKYKTETLGCSINTKTVFIECTFYGVINDPEGKRFGLEQNKNATVIVLP